MNSYLEPHVIDTINNIVIVQVNPQFAYIFQDCFADSSCSELIGKKYNDAGTQHTIFYTDNYPSFDSMPKCVPYDCFDGYPPGVFKRKSSELVWIKVSMEKYNYYISGKGPKNNYVWWL